MIKRVDKRLQAVQCLTGNKIKIIACITMLIDHFSKIFLESMVHRFCSNKKCPGIARAFQ